MKKNMFLYLLNEKTEFILSSEIKCPKSGMFTNNNFTGWGESGRVILQVSIAVFSGAVEKFFGQRWLSPPLEKIGPYAYDLLSNLYCKSAVSTHSKLLYKVAHENYC